MAAWFYIYFSYITAPHVQMYSRPQLQPKNENCNFTNTLNRLSASKLGISCQISAF